MRRALPAAARQGGRTQADNPQKLKYFLSFPRE